MGQTQANLSVEITAMRDTNITLGLPAESWQI